MPYIGHKYSRTLIVANFKGRVNRVSPVRAACRPGRISVKILASIGDHSRREPQISEIARKVGSLLMAVVIMAND